VVTHSVTNGVLLVDVSFAEPPLKIPELYSIQISNAETTMSTITTSAMTPPLLRPDLDDAP
jgi:hypothetical protein